MGNSVYVAGLLSNWKEHLVWETEFTFSRLEWTNQPWRTQDKRQRHGWNVRERRRGAEKEKRERETLSWIGRHIGCITFLGAWRQCGEWIAAMVTASDPYLFLYSSFVAWVLIGLNNKREMEQNLSHLTSQLSAKKRLSSCFLPPYHFSLFNYVTSFLPVQTSRTVWQASG